MSVKKITFGNLTGFGESFTSSPETSPAALCVNFHAEGNVLTDGFTLGRALFNGNALSLPEGVKGEKIFVSVTNAGEKLLFAGGGTVYEADISSDHPVFTQTDITYTGNISFANVTAYGNPCTVTGDSEGRLCLYDGFSSSFSAVDEGVVAVCEFFGRLVAVTDSKAYISAPNDPFNFSSLAGGFTLDTGRNLRAKGAAVFGNEVVIAGERGVCRVGRSEFGNSFTARTLFADGERLLPETVASGGEYAYVFTERGLALYNGASVFFKFEKTGVHAGDGACGFIWNGRYHACVKTRQNAEKRLILSFGNDSCDLMDTTLVSVAYDSAGKRLFAVSDSHAYVLTAGGKPIPPFHAVKLVTAETDFGVGGKKVLTEFSLYTEKDVRLIITADGRRRLYRVTGGKGRRIIRPHVAGHVFSFAVTAEGPGAKISAPQAEIEY